VTSALIWLAVIIYVEAVTEIITSSGLFKKFREKIEEKNEFLGNLVSCGYCCSVWVSITVAWTIPGAIIFPLVDFVIKVFVLHRLSNILHEGFSRWFSRHPWMIVLQKNEKGL